MKSIKTGFVVVVMLVVVYGAYKLINKESIAPPQGVSDLMATNFPDMQFPDHGAGGSPQPPSVQMPGAGTDPSNAFDTHPGEATMPVLRPPAPLAGGESASPYATDVGHGHGGAGHTAEHQTPAPVVGPDSSYTATPAPVVGPETSSPATYSPATGTSRFAAADPQGAEPSGTETGSSVYGQPQPEPQDSGSGWGNYDTAADTLGSTGFEMAWSKVQQLLTRGQLSEALAELSVWYGSSEIPQDKRAQMTELLDQLAGAVIYSPEHLLDGPHDVKPGETLQDIALSYQVPPQLLANVNGLSETAQPAPGTQLKVIRGPFNALISLDRQELTLIVDGRYAGRFPISLGNDPQPRTGEFAVREKETQRTFIDREGRKVAPGEDANPYGPYWIGLDGSMGIHGAAPTPQTGRRESTGSIIVSPEDAADLFAILSQDSRIVIRR